MGQARGSMGGVRCREITMGGPFKPGKIGREFQNSADAKIRRHEGEGRCDSREVKLPKTEHSLQWVRQGDQEGARGLRRLCG